VLFVCCLIVVPLPPGENPFAVNNNNNNNNERMKLVFMYRKEGASHQSVAQVWHVNIQVG
jgi:hypothetical protein